MKKYIYIALLILVMAGVQSLNTRAVKAAVSPCVVIKQNLSYRSTNKSVTTLQDFLRANGYLSAASTGYFGPATLGAVKKFQTAEKLSAIGVVGPLTRAAITRVSCSQQSVPVASPSAQTSTRVTASVSTQTAMPLKTEVESSEFAFDPAWRNTVVNLHCFSVSSYLGGGSGVIIDPRGIILTNAHVGHYFLFADWPTERSFFDCSVRTGSPAVARYRAKLLYIPKGWIADELVQIPKIDDKEYVYGKDDYALLYITESINPKNPLPETFPYLPLSTGTLSLDAPVYVIGHPASYLGGRNVLYDLHLISSRTTVLSKRSLPGENGDDIITLKGSIAGQHGTSGGAVIRKGGALVGVPTFFDTVIGNTTDENTLSAITIDHISRDMKRDMGLSLAEFLAHGDFAAVSDQFLKGDGGTYQCEISHAWGMHYRVVIPYAPPAC